MPVTSKVIKGAVGRAAGALEEMGHPQPATRIRTDYAAAQGFVSNNTKQKRSRAFGGRPWWLKDREAVLQLCVIWGPGVYNLANCPTKHHPAQHHKLVRPVIKVITRVWSNLSRRENNQKSSDSSDDLPPLASCFSGTARMCWMAGDRC